MKLRFLSDLLRVFIIKFRENPSSGSQVVSCGQTDARTDRYDEANSSLFAVLRKSLEMMCMDDCSNSVFFSPLTFEPKQVQLNPRYNDICLHEPLLYRQTPCGAN
jgi:hypothetical protein